MCTEVLMSVVSWAHDLGAALFLVCAYITWFVLRLTTGSEEGPSGIAGRLLRHLAVLHWASFLAVMSFGALRLYFYLQTTAGVQTAELPLLVWKHVFFTVLLIVGFAQYFRKESKLLGG